MNLSAQTVFDAVSIAVVVLGIIKSKDALLAITTKGLRTSAFRYIVGVQLVWLPTAGAVHYFGLDLLKFIWRRPDLTALVVSVAIAMVAYTVFNFLIKVLTGQKKAASYSIFAAGFSQEQRQLIAVHEMGHLLAHATIARESMPPLMAKVSSGVNGVAGYVRSVGDIRRLRLPTAARLEWECLMLLAGVTAEEVVYGQSTTGAGDDLNRWHNLATILLTQGLTRYPFPTDKSETSVAVRVDSYRDLLTEQKKRVFMFLSLNKNLLIRAADELQAKQKLSDTDCRRILSQVKNTNYITSIGRFDLEA